MPHARFPILSTCAALTLALAACGQTPQGQHGAQDQIAAAPTFTPTACRSQLAPDQTEGRTVRCGYVSVPENRAAPNGRTVKVNVAVFKAQSATPAPDPLLFVTGGPGLSGQTVASVLGGPVAGILQGPRDVVVFDQRGVEFSEPSLDCPEITQVSTVSLTLEAAVAARVEGARSCRDRLAGSGVDLGAYSSAAIAADANDLRRALGYDKMNVLAVSYGTRVALELERRYPETLRSVILDGVLPPQKNAIADPWPAQDRTLGLVFDACAADAACNAAYPDLPNVFEQTVSRLNAAPAPVGVKDPVTGGPQTLTVDGDDLVSVVSGLLGNRNTYVQVPALVTGADKGDYTLLAQQLQPAAPDVAAANNRLLSEGTFYSVECGEDAKAPTLAPALARLDALRPSLKRYAKLIVGGELGICNSWTDANHGRSDAVTSAVPTLLLSGQFDPATPPQWAELAAQTLGKSFLFEFPYAGHVTLLNEPFCALTLYAGFLADPNTKPDGSCVAGIQKPQFAGTAP